ncbi:MAG TPA: tetratricopeptide repeat protein [bacterium]|nr:tetratricopeptide repeat protein [bacterium]
MQNEFQFYNRENELRVLLEAFELEVVRKKGSLAHLIQGRTGVGKTRLVQEFINRIGEDKSIASRIPNFSQAIHVLHYNCRKESREPYLPFVKITQQIKKRTQKYHILQRIGMLAIALFPFHDVIDDLQKLAEEIESDKSAEDAIRKKEIKIFRKYLKTLKNKSRKAPLIIHIQNVQWIDLYSMELLQALLNEEESFCGMIILEESEIGASDEQIKNKLDILIEKEQLKRLTLKPLGKGYEIELLEKRFQPNLFTASEYEYIYTLSEGCPGILEKYADEWIKNKFLYQEGGTWKKISGFEERIKPPYQKLLDLIITFLQDGEISAREQNLINNFAQEWNIGHETVASMISMILKCRELGYEIEERVHSGSLSQDAFLAFDKERNRYIVEYIPNVPEITEDISPREVKHPKLLPAKRIIRSGDSLLIVNDYFSGKTLRELRDEAHETHVSNVLRMAIQIAEGVAELHRNGFTHGYLRPEAIIRTDEGEIRVTAIDASQIQLLEQKEKEKYLNYLAYQSPEQINGEKIDFRSDIFSFGILLYEMLTGELPFKGEKIGELKQNILYAPFPDLDKITPSIHPEVQKILNKCLQKNPENRYQLADELVQDLKKVILEAPQKREKIYTPGGEDQPKPGKSKTKLKKRALPVTAFALLAVFVALFYLFFAGHKKPLVPDTIVIYPFEAKGTLGSKITPSIVEYLIMDDILQSSEKAILTPKKFALLNGKEKVVPEVEIGADIYSKKIGYNIDLLVKKANERRKKYTFSFNDPSALLTGAIQKMTRKILGAFKTVHLRRSTFTHSWDAFVWFYKGEKAWEKLETTASKQNFRSALAIDPNFVLAKLRLAQVLTFEGNQVEAQNLLQEIEPHLNQLSYLDALRAKALDLRLKGDLRGQINVLRQIYDRFPARKEAPYEVAEAYYQICDIDNAIDYYQKALQLDPDFARAHNHIGYCYSHLGKHKEAIKHFKKYVELDGTANSYDSMGDGYMACGMLDSAAWAKEQGIKLDSTIDYLYQGLCYIRIRQGRFQEAEQNADLYRQYTHGNQNLANVYFLKALIKYQQRNFRAALDSCKKAEITFDTLDVVTRNHDLHWLMALTYSRLGKWKSFLREKYQIDSLVSANNINATNYIMGIYKYSRHLEAVWQAHKKNLQGVLNIIKEFDGTLKNKIKDHGSNFGPAYLNTSFAEILMRHFPSQKKLIIARLDSALAYNRNYALAHYDLRNLYRRMGDKKEAAQQDKILSGLWQKAHN